jgi:hypothetical protein
MSNPGDTATRDEKKNERKSARVRRPIQREGGNTGQAGKETAHKEKIIGSILHEGPVVKGGIKKKLRRHKTVRSKK